MQAGSWARAPSFASSTPREARAAGISTKHEHRFALEAESGTQPFVFRLSSMHAVSGHHMQVSTRAHVHMHAHIACIMCTEVFNHTFFKTICSHFCQDRNQSTGSWAQISGTDASASLSRVSNPPRLSPGSGALAAVNPEIVVPGQWLTNTAARERQRQRPRCECIHLRARFRVLFLEVLRPLSRLVQGCQARGCLLGVASFTW